MERKGKVILEFGITHGCGISTKILWWTKRGFFAYRPLLHTGTELEPSVPNTAACSCVVLRSTAWMEFEFPINGAVGED
jgi:hypothetical protein